MPPPRNEKNILPWRSQERGRDVSNTIDRVQVVSGFVRFPSSPHDSSTRQISDLLGELDTELFPSTSEP